MKIDKITFFDATAAKEIMNEYSQTQTPFFFFVAFDKQTNIVVPLHELNDIIQYDFSNKNNGPLPGYLSFEKKAVSFNQYKIYFDKVQYHIRRGDTYLMNLTMPTEVKTNLSLADIYKYTTAPYRLYIKDTLVCFSPEPFVSIENNRITTYPMKGTMDAKVSDAKTKLLDDEKELAEHFTIVDLLRNDLSIVATNVQVDKFRYVETIKTNHSELLQTSSKISGELLPDYQKKYGDLLMSLLPAGSISGAPKEKTIQLIKEIEDFDRGFFTGVFGVYNGQSLKSAVAIRYLEQRENQLYFFSGGGIVSHSRVENEYNELLDKVYLPI